MQFDHRCTNRTVATKMADLSPLWSKLRRSLANTSQKLKAARQCAWPRAFHSGSIVHLGWHRIHKQRVQLMKAVGYSMPSASSLIQFGLSMQPKNDPGYWLLLQSLRHFRKFADDFMSTWSLEMAALRSDRQEPGPCGVMLSRLKDVHWQHLQHFTFLDHLGNTIDVCQVSVQEIEVRVRDAWWSMIAQQAAKRKDFSGIQNVDVPVTFSAWKSQLPDAQGYLRVLMNGAQVCANRHYADEEACRCKFCGEQDSVRHRHWECEGTKASREQLRSDTLELLPSLPVCTTLHGWATVSPHLSAFRQQIASIQSSTHTYAFAPQMWDHHLGCDLFPDGSADVPRCPTTRLATWAVVISHWDDPDQFVQLSAGPVPGWCQTVLRAEICAMISCLQFLALVRCGGRIWTDNALVQQRTQAILAGVYQITANTPDGDLWGQIVELAPAVRDKVVVAKVYSHIQSETLSAAEQWVVRGNTAADQAAEMARDAIAPEILQLAQRVRSDQQRSRTLIHDLQAHFVRVARQFVESDEVRVDPEKLPAAVPQGPEMPLQAVANQLRWNFPERLQFPGCHKITSWLLEIADPNAPLKFIAWHELFVSFQQKTQMRGVCRKDLRNWSLMPIERPWSFLHAARQFSQYMLALWRGLTKDAASSFARPANLQYVAWTGGVFTRVDRAAQQAWTSWMQKNVPHPTITHVGQQLSQLPEVDHAEPPVATFG